MDLFAQIKKSVASVALAAMSFMLVAPAANAALPFTDASEIPSWAEEAIEELMDQGVLSGNDDGSFAPNRQLNRAEVSKIIVLASGVDFDTTGGPHFPDVDPGAWYYDYIETMYNYGWINGYPDGLFRPAVGINRAEIAKMVVNAFEINQDLSGAPHFDDVNEGDWFYGYVETAYNNGLMRGYGDGTFGPANPVTRAETAHITYNSQLVVAQPVGPSEGTMEVTLSMDTPRGTNIPYNATSVPYLTVELTASDDSDVEISSLTFTRLGLGDNDDFDNVWLEIDGFKVGNDKSVNNDDIVELRFNPPIVVPAGQTLWADVVASAKYTEADKNVGHHNRFALVSADDVVSTAANVVGDFPIEGEEMEVAQYQVSTLKFSTLGSDTTVDVGDNFIEVGKFRLLNASNTNKDVEIRAITFKNDGTAELEDNLENVALYVSGEQISAETIIDGDYMTFRLDNGVTGGYVIEDGDSRIFSIRADIVSAERGDNINLKIDNFEDVVGVEIGTSFGVKALSDNTKGLDFASGSTSNNATTCTGTEAEDSCARLRAYTIDSGDLNISRDPSSLGNQEYSPGSNDVVLMTARVVVDQPLLVDGLYINVGSGSTVKDKDDLDGVDNQLADFNAAFDNFRLYLNDKLIDSENDFTLNGTDATVTDYRLNFNTTFEIAGTSIMKLVGNVQDAAETGDKLKLEVSATDFQSPEYISTGDQVSSSQMLGSAQGSFVEVRVSSLIATETSGISDGDKIVAGVDDVTFMEFVLDNNDSGDVNVTSATVTADTANNANGSDDGVSGSTRTYSNFTLAIFVDGTQQGSAKNLDSTGQATFNDLSVIIPSAGQKEFTVVVDTIEASSTVIDTTPLEGQDETALGLSGVDVASTAGMTAGDIIIFTGAAGDIERAITTVVDADSLALNADIGENVADGSAVTIKHQIQLDLTAVDADNVENGQSVTVKDGGGTEVSAANHVQGPLWELVASGSLTVTLDSTVFSNILVANESNVEVLKVRFNAADDEVQVKDLYFVNDFNGDEDAGDTVGGKVEAAIGDRLDFKLYNEAGQLIQEKQMTSGTLHFEMANQDRVRVPKDDSTFISVKVDVRDINKANQTGKVLQLSLDGDATDVSGTNVKGIEAVTAATGDDIDTPAAGWESSDDDVTSQEFIAYRTQIEIRHAATQPSFQDPSLASQEVYRFSVSADANRQAELGRLAFDVTLSGIKGNGAAGDGPDFVVRQVKGDGTVDSSSSVTTSVVDDFNDDADDSQGRVWVTFDNQKLSGGETRTYALFMDNSINDGTEADDDAVSVDIAEDTSYAAPNDRYDGSIINTTLTLFGEDLVGGEDPASVNIVVGGVTVAVDFADGATNAAMATALAAAIHAETEFSAAAVGGVVTISASDGATAATITNLPALASAINTADASSNAHEIRLGGPAIVWSDESSTSHSAASLDWLNGYLIDIDSTAKVNAD
ncbi:S-layer homology domain-containing protein [Candidatus Gracilibacteria bacterium]|nr:S-layer homology domain-containing protein [Candidatus Gracilibacteria bacterium]MCF7819222.1 S-layer homology domain-containing protein [Candidatus Gracilibacteria bacterium]